MRPHLSQLTRATCSCETFRHFSESSDRAPWEADRTSTTWPPCILERRVTSRWLSVIQPAPNLELPNHYLFIFSSLTTFVQTEVILVAILFRPASKEDVIVPKKVRKARDLQNMITLVFIYLFFVFFLQPCLYQ